MLDGFRAVGPEEVKDIADGTDDVILVPICIDQNAVLAHG